MLFDTPLPSRSFIVEFVYPTFALYIIGAILAASSSKSKKSVISNKKSELTPNAVRHIIVGAYTLCLVLNFIAASTAEQFIALQTLCFCSASLFAWEGRSRWCSQPAAEFSCISPFVPRLVVGELWLGVPVEVSTKRSWRRGATSSGFLCRSEWRGSYPRG